MPMENSLTWTPQSFATAKWPNSWIAMTAPKMSSAATKVMKTDIISPILQVCSHECTGHTVTLIHIREAVVAAEAVAVHDSLH